MNKKTLTTLCIALTFAVGPAMAQHGGMHEPDPTHGAGQGHMDMGGMHSDQMMNHMNMVMDQLSEMMQEMHTHHAEMTDQMIDHSDHNNQDLHADMMQEMSGDMGQVMVAMKSMLEHMQGYMNDDRLQDNHSAMNHMNSMMDNLEGMMKSGQGMMSDLADKPQPRDESGHHEHH